MFEEYEDSWLQSQVIEPKISYTFSEHILSKIRQEHTSYSLDRLKNFYFQKIQDISPKLGNNIIVALSGGIDSQTVCLSLKESNVKFTAATMVMKDDFNQPDVKSAKDFCLKHNIDHITIEIDIINFLTKKLWTYSEKYKCPSPQFCSHFWFYEKILELYDPSCLVIGGTAPRINNGNWFYPLSTAQTSWKNFRKLHNCNMIGDFFSYSFDLSLLIMMTRNYNETLSNKDLYEMEMEEYIYKKDGLKKAGFDISPQYKKYNGFEKLKKYFNTLTNNTTGFNTQFRRPLEAKYKNYHGKLSLPNDITNILNETFYNINKP